MKQFSVYVAGSLFDTFSSELLAQHAAYLYRRMGYGEVTVKKEWIKPYYF